jgi:hypothetical protein
MVVVVLDEAVLGATDTFVAEQGVGREATEDLDNDFICEAGQYVPLVGGLLHFFACSRMRACLVMKSQKRKIIQQRSNSEVHNSYQSLTVKLMEL